VHGSTESFTPAFAGAAFGQAPRYAKDMKVIQLDIAPEEIGHSKASEVACSAHGVRP
jgi:hypothetical protein